MEGDARTESRDRDRSPRLCSACRSSEPEHGAVPARSLPVQLNPCADKSAALRRRFRRALGTGRAFGMPELFFSSSRTVSDSDRRADRAARSKICPGGTWSFGGAADVSRETIGRKPAHCPLSTARLNHRRRPARLRRCVEHCSAHVSAAHLAIKRGWLHVQARPV